MVGVISLHPPPFTLLEKNSTLLPPRNLSTPEIDNPLKTHTMKNNKETWKLILQIIASIISAALTALGTTSCMGRGPF